MVIKQPVAQRYTTTSVDMQSMLKKKERKKWGCFSYF